MIVGLVLSSCGEATPTPTATAPTPTATKPTATAPTATKPTATAPTATKPTVEAPYGTITITSTDFGVEATDPTLFESTWSWYYCDTLLAFTDKGVYVGELAESWSLDATGKIWTFNIRKGVKFHNGDPLTANDVFFTMERFTSPESKNPWSNQLRDQKVSERVVDEFTFEFVTKDPQPQLLDTFCWVRVMSKTYFDRVGEEEWRANPVGTGPWKFVEHVAETSFKVEANTEYWRPEQVPYFQYIIELQVPEEATQVAMLKRGEIDIPMGLTVDRRVELEEEGWQTRVQNLALANMVAIIGPHLEGSGPLHDIRIRKALSYAINRQEMCDTFWRGTAKPGGRFFLVPGAYGVTDDLVAPDPYDVNLAKQLMAEAGYPDKWADPTINVFTTAGPGVDFFQAIVGYWDKAGFKTKINILDASVWLQYIFIQQLKGDESFLGWIWSWAGAAFNGTAYCRNLYTSYGIHQVTVDAAVTALFDKYIAEMDPVKAVQYYTDWQRAAKDLYTSFGIGYVESRLVVSDKIGDFTVNPHMFFNDAACGIKHPGQATRTP
jgi:peptide/nickel transport system substrate-binding protein